ncbi:hypothetical protein [Streptomyces sp. MUM 178J]|uniref:hypothetical protein n=1 Tax=Streptomyces sp. MUM 178J TaxID=2791991 RepID=UPI002E7C2C33|nr:hypothetical protein [Streptomyces sp. MUM 178J]WRQ79845.1 hypothetical protein I3F59_011070 [Streptomyces sp. MUM 178J]
MKRARASKRNDALLYAQRAAMGLVAALLLAAGFWSSWSTAQHVILSKGREHGTLTVTGCSTDVCTGRYAPDAPGADWDVVLAPSLPPSFAPPSRNVAYAPYPIPTVATANTPPMMAILVPSCIWQFPLR